MDYDCYIISLFPLFFPSFSSGRKGPSRQKEGEGKGSENADGGSQQTTTRRKQANKVIVHCIIIAHCNLHKIHNITHDHILSSHYIIKFHRHSSLYFISLHFVITFNTFIVMFHHPIKSYVSYIASAHCYTHCITYCITHCIAYIII